VEEGRELEELEERGESGTLALGRSRTGRPPTEVGGSEGAEKGREGTEELRGIRGERRNAEGRREEEERREEKRWRKKRGIERRVDGEGVGTECRPTRSTGTKTCP